MRKFTFLKSLVVLAFFLALHDIKAQSQLSCYNIIGYLPSWSGDPAAVDYSKYTHINYAFGIPNTNGAIGAIENSSKLVDLVNRGHANRTKVLLSIGGWLATSPNDTPFEAISTNSTAITTFVNACANLITQYNLDGVDIDWEYPTSQARWNALMVPLATRVHGMGKLLTAAVSGDASSGNNFGNLEILDLVNIMSYDCNCPTNAPYSYAVSGMDYWTSRGVPQAKRILGTGFYSSDNTTAIQTQKANLAKTRGAGIMIWEISAPGDINAIYNTLGTICKGTTPECTRYSLPGTLQSESYCTMSGVQTETTTDTGGGQNVGYIETGDWMDYSVNVVSAGTHTLGFRVASLSGGGQVQLRSGSTVLATANIGATGGWQTWTTITTTANLAAGNQTLRLYASAGGFNINWVQFTSGSSNPAPSVSITSPSATATFTAPANISLAATAKDVAPGTISLVEFFSGTTKIGQRTVSPYTLTWSNVPAGTYSITAKATDNQGATTTSAVRVVTVNGTGNTPPTVSITTPVNGASFTSPASITISANAADANGTISSVQFYNGTTLLGTDATSPYSFAWTNVPAGSYSIIARATDNQGATASATVNVVVNSSTSANIAYNKPVTTTSSESATYSGAKAVDANGTTRWSSSFANNQNFVVDLGANYNINRIRIAWEAAYARDYQIQVSTNNSTWTTVREFWGKASSAADDYTGLATTARWVKVYCINRATAYGFSIWELEVYGANVARLGNEEATTKSTIYPNPSNGQVMIDLGEAANEENTITVSNSSGKAVSIVKSSDNQRLLDLTPLPSGMYFIRVSNSQGSRVHKFFKE